MTDDRKKSAEQLFPETRDWSAVSEELALQLNTDAQHLVKKYLAPNVSDLAAQIAAKISSEENSASQSVSLHIVNEKVSHTDSASDMFLDENPHGRIVIDRAESLEWLKISAAAMLFLAATASTIWYTSISTKSPANSVTVVKENVQNKPQMPAVASQDTPAIVAISSKANHEPVSAAQPIRGTLRTEESPIHRNSHVGEVSFDPIAPARDPKQRAGSEAEMLRSQLSAFEHVIQSMQREIEDLRRETTKLQKELAESKAPERKSKSRRLFGAKD